jgi:trans-aconitate methyltransferase
MEYQHKSSAIDTSIAHIARVQDYWLGGKDNYLVDREAGDEAVAAFPELVESVRHNRAFLARTVRYLTHDAGIRQFLDIGTGIPATNNTHEVAQLMAPESRVVYVDNDPIVLAHARALLTSAPEGATDYLDADIRDTEKILAEAQRILDFSRPIAIMLVAVLQFVPDHDDPFGIVNRLRAAVPPGSYLVISHPASDIKSEAMMDMTRRLNHLMAQSVTMRSHSAVTRFFEGFELLPPGVVRGPAWRPESELDASGSSNMWSGLARKPDPRPQTD